MEYTPFILGITEDYGIPPEVVESLIEEYGFGMLYRGIYIYIREHNTEEE